jgi:hypothetical protein
MEQQSPRAGAVLATSVTVWIRNLVPFTLLGLLAYTPLFLYLWLGPPLALEGARLDTGRAGLMTAVTLLLDLLATGMMVYATVQYTSGRPVTVGQVITAGARRVLPLVGVTLLAALCIGGAAGAILVPALLVRSTGLAVLLGIPAVIITVILVCMLWVALPVAVIERPGLVAALRRSRELTAGYRLHIFATLLVIGAVRWLLSELLGLALTDADGSPVLGRELDVVLSMTVSAIGGAFVAVTSAVSYQGLRAAKEGIGVDQLARVFD